MKKLAVHGRRRPQISVLPVRIRVGRSTKLGAAIIAVCLALAAHSKGEEKKIQWTPGPVKAKLGTVAEVQVDKGYLFADAAETRRIMELTGNRPSHQEVGLIAPAREGEDWFLKFDYDPVGYVADDEKDRIDAEALLDGIRRGTEKANEFRKEKGFPALHITGWSEAPHYDSKSHNLVWALDAKDDGGVTVVNYDQRLLGRRGYLSVTLVSDPADLARLKPEVQSIIAGVTYTQGNRYAEFVKGDKLAGYGLTALVAGGAGAAAVKLGLLGSVAKIMAKAWKAVLLGLAALATSIKKLWAKIVGKREGAPTPE